MQSDLVVVEGAGDQTPVSPDAASTPKIDGGWELRRESVESALDETGRVSTANPDGSLDDARGDVSGDAVDEDIDRTT